jgi:hypothetical protein
LGCEAAGKVRKQRFARRGLRNNPIVARFRDRLHTSVRDFAMLPTAPNLFNPGAREIVMAKGQMRSNKEKKKPKADKNLKKGGAAPSPFAAGKTPAGQSPNSKKS